MNIADITGWLERGDLTRIRSLGLDDLAHGWQVSQQAYGREYRECALCRIPLGATPELLNDAKNAGVILDTDALRTFSTPYTYRWVRRDNGQTGFVTWHRYCSRSCREKAYRIFDNLTRPDRTCKECSVALSMITKPGRIPEYCGAKCRNRYNARLRRQRVRTAEVVWALTKAWFGAGLSVKEMPCS